MEARVRCVIMRGGTSKAIFFSPSDLPSSHRERDALIAAVFGSPDVRQIDGLGGADPLTSKLAIVAPAAGADADVDYTFGQVGIISTAINYRVNCGNTAAAVGLYALQEGLAAVRDGTSTVAIRCTNTGKHVVAEVPTENGEPVMQGRFRIAGVPRAGAEIRLTFRDPGGGITGRLLPTGNAIDEITLPSGRTVPLSLVDCGNLYALAPASAWGLDGTELPDRIEAMPGLRREIEELREIACRDLLPDRTNSNDADAARLKVALVGPPSACRTLGGDPLARDDVDLVARVINQERVHKAFAVTGAICVAAAATLRGSIVNRLAPLPVGERAALRIGHPQGVIEPIAEARMAETGDDEVVIRSVQISRTARRIMDGFVYVPVGQQ